MLRPRGNWRKPWGYPLQDWTPAQLFAGGWQGAWYDPSDPTTVFQDAAGTTPAVVGDPVGLIRDKSGNGYHAAQATAAKRPTLQSDGNLRWLLFDGVDDFFTTGLALTNNAELTLAAAIRGSGAAPGLSVFRWQSSGEYISFLYTGGKVIFSADGGITGIAAGAEADVAHVHVAQRKASATLATWRDGIQIASRAASAALLTVSPNNMRIGSYTDTVDLFLGRFYGGSVLFRYLSLPQRQQLEAYLAKKSGVAL